jgi:hypothetical protein
MGSTPITVLIIKLKGVMMNIDIGCIPEILNLYEVVKSEIVCAGMSPSDFTADDFTQRIVTLMGTNKSDKKSDDPRQKKYALIVTADEVACLGTLFSSFRIEGYEPESIQRKLRVILNNERYG